MSTSGRKITERTLKSLRPKAKDYFVRDTSITGFGVKVTPAGRIVFIAEGRMRGGGTKRVTLGPYPVLSLPEARAKAIDALKLLREGIDPLKQERAERAKQEALSITLGEMFAEYMAAKERRPATVRDYQSTMRTVFPDWMGRPIREISRKDIVERYRQTQSDKGAATASKSMRILSAVFTFAMADEVEGERLIRENPCDVLRQKKMIARSNPRKRYLTDGEIYTLIHFFEDEMGHPQSGEHGVSEQGKNYIMLLLVTGFRKSEGLRLRWDDVDWQERTVVARNTKNHTDHTIPMSRALEEILRQQQEVAGASVWVFPAKRGDGHMTEPKSQLAKIKKATCVNFRLHDLRRTFASHALFQGVDYELIRRSLNHKSGGGVTGSYILTQVETLRPVFDAIADGYHDYYDHDWRQFNDVEAEGSGAEGTPVARQTGD